MKRFTTIILTLLSAIMLYSCAEDNANNNTQQTPPIPPLDQNYPIKDNKTTKINTTELFTQEIINPFNDKAELTVYMEYNKSQSFTINPQKTTCGIFTNNNGLIALETEMKANSKCVIAYEFKPTTLKTEVMTIRIDYLKNPQALCNNLNYYNYVMANKYKTLEIYHKVIDNDVISPEIVSIDFGNIDYVFQDKQFKYKFPTLEPLIYDFKLDIGTYIVSNDSKIEIINQDTSKCQYTSSKLEVKALPCKLKLTPTSKYPELMFTGNNKTYIYKANIEPKEQYNEIDIRTVTDYTKTIDLSEELGTQFPNNYYDVIQKTDSSESQFYFSGYDANVFHIVGTKYNPCVVKNNTAKMPITQKTCFIRVALKDEYKIPNRTYHASFKEENGYQVTNIKAIISNDGDEIINWFREKYCINK